MFLGDILEVIHSIDAKHLTSDKYTHLKSMDRLQMTILQLCDPYCLRMSFYSYKKIER